MAAKRFLIVYDGKKFHVRRLKSTTFDAAFDEKVYRCDAPIANDLPSLAAACDAAWKWRNAKRRKPSPKRSHGT